MKGTLLHCTADFVNLRRYCNNPGTHGSPTPNITGTRADVGTLSDHVCQAHIEQTSMEAVTAAAAAARAVKLDFERLKQPDWKLSQPASIFCLGRASGVSDKERDKANHR